MKSMFSPTEMAILRIIGRRKITINALAKEFVADTDNTVIALNVGNAVNSAIRRINNKCNYYSLDWHVTGQGCGRGGKTVWKEKLQQTKEAK